MPMPADTTNFLVAESQLVIDEVGLFPFVYPLNRPNDITKRHGE
jgi:hypothetical protein